jgi:hypothetical protein
MMSTEITGNTHSTHEHNIHTKSYNNHYTVRTDGINIRTETTLLIWKEQMFHSQTRLTLKKPNVFNV